MTHAQIAANARAPYAAKILELEAQKEVLRSALKHIKRIADEATFEHNEQCRIRGAIFEIAEKALFA